MTPFSCSFGLVLGKGIGPTGKSFNSLELGYKDFSLMYAADGPRMVYHAFSVTHPLLLVKSKEQPLIFTL